MVILQSRFYRVPFKSLLRVQVIPASKLHFHWFEEHETLKPRNCFVPPSINTKSDHQLEKWLWPISSDNSTTPQDDRVPRIVQKLFFLFHFFLLTIGNVKKCAQNQWFSLLYRISLNFAEKVWHLVDGSLAFEGQ